VKGSFGHFFLGCEVAAVRGPLGYRIAELGQGGPAHDDTTWEAYIQWYTLRTRARVMYVSPQPAAPVPDAMRVLASTVYPVRRDQHYDKAVSLKIHRLSLMVLYILQFTTNFFCNST
jgi:hypothetical protein